MSIERDPEAQLLHTAMSEPDSQNYWSHNLVNQRSAWSRSYGLVLPWELARRRQRATVAIAVFALAIYVSLLLGLIWGLTPVFLWGPS